MVRTVTLSCTAYLRDGELTHLALSKGEALTDSANWSQINTVQTW